ncbi:MAG: hypothetical protein R2853_21110 [Thermomicrobiales bacterium]
MSTTAIGISDDERQERIRQKIQDQQARMAQSAADARHRPYELQVETARWKEDVLVLGMIQARNWLVPKYADIKSFKVPTSVRAIMHGTFDVRDPQTGRAVPPELSLSFTVNSERQVLQLKTLVKRDDEARGRPLPSLTGPLASFTSADSIRDAILDAWLGDDAA